MDRRWKKGSSSPSSDSDVDLWKKIKILEKKKKEYKDKYKEEKKKVKLNSEKMSELKVDFDEIKS